MVTLYASTMSLASSNSINRIRIDSIVILTQIVTDLSRDQMSCELELGTAVCLHVSKLKQYKNENE